MGEARPRKRFCPPRNALSSLKSVTATLRGLVCRSSSPSFYSGWQLGDVFVFPPLQLVHSPPANCMLGDTAVSLLQCTEPVPATRQAQHFSLHHPEQGRRGLSFTVEGAAASRPFSTPHLRYVFLYTTLWFLCRTPSRMGASTWGIAVGSAHPWPNVSLYAFPPIKLIPEVLCRVKVSGARLLLIAPFWPSQTWFSELTPLLSRPPWEIPIRRDLLSQLQGKIWHPQPELWKLWVGPYRAKGCDWWFACRSSGNQSPRY